MTLTAALAIVAALVLAAVVAHGAWHARRAGPRQPQTLEPVARTEPTLHNDASEPTAELAPLPIATVEAGTRRSVLRIDALIDAIVPLRLEAPVSGEFLLAFVSHDVQ